MTSKISKKIILMQEFYVLIRLSPGSSRNRVVTTYPILVVKGGFLEKIALTWRPMDMI